MKSLSVGYATASSYLISNKFSSREKQKSYTYYGLYLTLFKGYFRCKKEACYIPM